MKGERGKKGKGRGGNDRSVVRSIFSEYRAKITRRAAGARKRFARHSVLFGAVNAFLLIVNLVIGISFPWFLFPLGGWAILLAGHSALSRQRQRQELEISATNELSNYQAGLLRKFHRQRSLFAVNSAVSLVTALFLGMTNLIVSPSFPWAFITAGGLGLSVLVHYLGFSSRRRSLLEEIGGELPLGSAKIIGGKKLRSVEGMTGMSLAAGERVAEANRIRQRIAEHLSDLREGHAEFGGEIAQLLDRYFEQIVELVRKREEAAVLAHHASPEAIETERDRLAARLDTHPSEALQAEYRRSIRQLDEQLASAKKLEEHLEIAELRINSAIGSLRQLEIDVVRMKGLPDFEESAVSKVLKERSRDLSEHLEDLAEGQRELEDLG